MVWLQKQRTGNVIRDVLEVRLLSVRPLEDASLERGVFGLIHALQVQYVSIQLTQG